MKKWMTLTGITIAAMLTLAGCGQAKKNSDQNKDNEAKVEETTIKAKGSDDEIVEVKQDPKNIVVFDMGSLDTIDQIGKGSSVKGVPVKHLPEYLKDFSDVKSVGTLVEPDLESVNQLKPEMIVISGRQKDLKKDLNAIAPTIYLGVDSENYWESTKKNAEVLGGIFNQEEKVKKQISQLDEEIADLKEKAQADGEKTLVVMANEGQLSAYGPGSRFGMIHTDFGFVPADTNIEASTHGQSISYEYILDKNPDILFVIDRTKAIGGDDSKNNVAENELIKQTNAGKNGKVIELEPDVWYLSGGGLKSTELMIQDVQKALDNQNKKSE